MYLYAPLSGYRDLGRAAVASVGVLLAPACPEPSDAAPTRRRTGFFVPPQTEVTGRIVFDIRLWPPLQKALLSAPLGRPRWSDVARQYQLVNSQLCANSRAQLRRYAAKKVRSLYPIFQGFNRIACAPAS